ncbi:FISUMP domain-containing protein [Fibrobacter sp. UWB12]|uniref:FISUMP domain-containing protein n=1 Tax=Fibrobacter sp. UWB12 TaxID=1896203 RepID=UPI0009336E8A|nr:FISUMP domain-containing protein [Fibrobacter sp. UWB12]
MTKIRGYIFAALFAVVAGCSNDVADAHSEEPHSGNIEIIRVPDSTDSESSSSSFSRSKITNIFFSNHVEVIVSSSSIEPSSSSKAPESSSSKPVPKSSSSEAKSSSSEPPKSSSATQSSSSSDAPKSSAALYFYDCTEHDCVTMEYLNPDVSYGEFLDKRDDQVYRTIVISNHVWTAQNMNYKIETEEGSEETNWCYANNPEHCQKFGRLYTWEAAKKVCPEGWHLPTVDEWAELLKDHSCSIEPYQDTVLIFNCSGGELKAAETWGKVNKDPNGFSVVAAGIHYTDGFHSYNEYALFWTSTEFEDPSFYAASFNESDGATLWPHNKNEYGLSIRCVKGNAE